MTWSKVIEYKEKLIKAIKNLLSVPIFSGQLYKKISELFVLV